MEINKDEIDFLLLNISDEKQIEINMNGITREFQCETL